MLTYFCVWKIKDYDHPGWWLFCQCLGTNEEITFMCLFLQIVQTTNKCQICPVNICLESTSEFDIPIFNLFGIF